LDTQSCTVDVIFEFMSNTRNISLIDGKVRTLAVKRGSRHDKSKHKRSKHAFPFSFI
jgi:hypothetical protein